MNGWILSLFVLIVLYAPLIVSIVVGLRFFTAFNAIVCIAFIALHIQGLRKGDEILVAMLYMPYFYMCLAVLVFGIIARFYQRRATI